MKKRGFTLIETMITIGIMAVLVVTIYPSIFNTQETRKLENEAMDILTTLQWAKFQAAKTRLNHRVEFVYDTKGWAFSVEKEDSPDEWTDIPGRVKKTISSRFNVDVNLHDQAVVFSPLGMLSNLSISQNYITIQSPILKEQNQDDQRTINVFAGGSVEYIKSRS